MNRSIAQKLYKSCIQCKRELGVYIYKDQRTNCFHNYLRILYHIYVIYEYVIYPAIVINS